MGAILAPIAISKAMCRTIEPEWINVKGFSYRRISPTDSNGVEIQIRFDSSNLISRFEN